jgi:stage II sporulation protein AA (anti-sigma F factor antagonist)
MLGLVPDRTEIMGKENFEITTRTEPTHHVVSIKGVLDAASESALTNVLDRLCQTDPPCILVDCGALAYLNSASFGIFFQYHRQCEARNGRLALCAMTPKIESIFKLLGLYHVLHIHPTTEDALSAIPAVNHPS